MGSVAPRAGDDLVGRGCGRLTGGPPFRAEKSAGAECVRDKVPVGVLGWVGRGLLVSLVDEK